MKHSHENPGARRAAPRRRQQVRHHVGPAGLRRFARDLAEYDVPGIPDSGHGPGLWKAHFVAGDLICIVAGRHLGGPVEIAVFDAHGQALVLSKVPGGLCRAATRVHASGVYAVRVRDLESDDEAGDPRVDGTGPHASSRSSDQLGSSAPFKLCRTRERPVRLRARMSPRRRRIRPRFVMNPAERVLRQLIGSIGVGLQVSVGGLRTRLSGLVRRDAPAAAAA